MKSPALPALLLCLTVPSHHASDLHVSPTGNDGNPGTLEAPLRTIQRGADLAQPGDTVLVAPGTYRERVAPPRGGTAAAPITYRSTQPLQAIIKGSDLWKPEWKQETANRWSAAVDPALFTDTAHADGANPFQIPSSSTPWGRGGRPEHQRGYPQSDPGLVYTLGQVFVDDILYRQAPQPDELAATPCSWYYHAATQRLTVHFPEGSPAGKTIEITTRRRIFAPHQRGLGYLIIDGFRMEHCGNQYPSDFWLKERPENQQAGALGTRSGHHWIIRNNKIQFANSIGLDLGNEGNQEADLETGPLQKSGKAGHHLVENNYLLHNGAAGTASYGGTDLTLRGNVVTDNNALQFTGKKRWESAGIKLHRPRRALIEGNYVADNYGTWGIWLDEGAGEGTRILRNLIIGHQTGLDFEIGKAEPALAANNIFINNNLSLSFRESGGLTARSNLFLGSGACAIKSANSPNRPGNWSAANLAFYHNLFAGPAAHFDLTPPDAYRSAGRLLDFNLYTGSPKNQSFSLAGIGSLTFPGWQRLWSGLYQLPGNDQNSRLISELPWTWDPATLQLTMTLPAKVSLPAANPDKDTPEDYHQRPRPSATPAPPGPFLNLKPGKNSYLLWNGIPLPPAMTAPPTPAPGN